MSAHSAAASPAEMSTSLIILCFSCLVLCITARNFRSDYNYEYYDNQNQWNDHSNDYHYEWKDHTEGIGQTCFEKYGVIRKEIFVQKKEVSPSGGQSVESGPLERSTSRVTRWTQIKIFQRHEISILNCPGPTWRQILCCQVVDIQQYARGRLGRVGAYWRLLHW